VVGGWGGDGELDCGYGDLFSCAERLLVSDTGGGGDAGQGFSGGVWGLCEADLEGGAFCLLSGLSAAAYLYDYGEVCCFTSRYMRTSIDGSNMKVLVSRE